MENVISNEKTDENKLQNAKNIIISMLNEFDLYVSKGHGPFLASFYDKNNNLIAKCANSVVLDNCSNNHAEMNAIKEAQIKLKTYDLSSYDLSIYITAEPCIMCLGAIMWSGIKEVYYSVSSKKVEEITGFDEGFKQNWFEEFKKRGIEVFGEIEVERGKKILKKYIALNKTIYKPSRN